MQYTDYSNLLRAENTFLIDSWRDIWLDNLSVPQNLLRLLPQLVLLPYDYYDIIASYLLIPSALATVIPHLFLYGMSGTGKTTLSKFAAKWYGINLSSPTDTFAGIRNSLNDRKYKEVAVAFSEENNLPIYKKIEVNTAMVYEDIDPSVLISTPNLYRLLKVSNDRSTDKMSMSSETKGQNMDFRTFCPKIFSSISAIHNDEAFKELQRRLIVIPFKRIEDLSDERLEQLGTSKSTWQSYLINIDAYHWNGFNSVFTSFWNKELAEGYLMTKKVLSKTLKGLSSKHRAISLDLLASGITTGIWPDETEAVNKLKSYFDWYAEETHKYAGITKYLRDYLRGKDKPISSRELYHQIQMWFNAGWILEKPKPKHLKILMSDLGLVLYEGHWIKR